MLSDTNKSQKIPIVILVAIVSGVTGGLCSGAIPAILEHDSLQRQINLVQNQTDNQKNELDDQKVKTGIMNDTLNAFVESTKKKSLISVKILPHVEGFPVEIGTKYVEHGPGQPQRQVNAVLGYVTLVTGTNATFDIVITNGGLIRQF